MSAYQPSMLDLMAGPSASLGSLPGRLVRHELTAGAWVDVLPGWVQASDAVFETLLTEVDWRAERRPMYDGVVDVPRLLRWYGPGEHLPHPALTEARERLSASYRAELGEPFVTAGMCLYRDGRDSVAWHGDTIGRGSTEDTMVAIISVGAARTKWVTATCSSWAAAASARGSTRCRKRTGRSGPGSASSSDRPACGDQAARPPSQFCHASVSVDGSRSSK